MNQLGADCLSTRWRKRFSVTCLNVWIWRWAQKCALGKQQDLRRNMELSRQCDRSQRSWKHAESPNGERWPATWRCTRPGFGPSWLTASALSSFRSPVGWVSVYYLTSLSQLILFHSHFLLLLLYFGLNGWIFIIQSVPLLTLSPLFIFQWFPSKSPFLSLSFYGLLWHSLIHLCHIKTFMTLNPVSLVCYSLPLKFRVATSPYLVFCCCFK